MLPSLRLTFSPPLIGGEVELDSRRTFKADGTRYTSVAVYMVPVDGNENYAVQTFAILKHIKHHRKILAVAALIP